MESIAQPVMPTSSNASGTASLLWVALAIGLSFGLSASAKSQTCANLNELSFGDKRLHRNRFRGLRNLAIPCLWLRPSLSFKKPGEASMRAATGIAIIMAARTIAARTTTRATTTKNSISASIYSIK
jgi:hypothetical protein